MIRIVVVGAGMAGGRTCEQLRRQGFTGEIVLLGKERHTPYDRPPLSKDVLHWRRDNTALPIDLRGLDIDSRFGDSATALDVPGRCLSTDHGALPFDGLVIATGAFPIRLPGPGPQLTLRTIDDARAIRSRLVPGSAVVVIGASWIGAEVATAALARGCSVVCLEAARAPFAASLGERVGSELAMLWNEVDLRTECRVREVVDGGVELADGTILHGDLVVTAASVLDRTSGSGPRHLSFDPVPYFWSDQFGRKLQFAGVANDSDSVIWRGDHATGSSSAAWVDSTGRLTALLTIDSPAEMAAGRRALAAGVHVNQ